MKRIILCICIVFCCMLQTTYGSPLVPKPFIPYSASVYKNASDPLGYRNLPVTIMMTLKDTFDAVIYSETQETMLNAVAEFKINIGEGTNQSPDYQTVYFRTLGSYCYTIIVHDPGGDVELTGMSYYLRYVHSYISDDSDALGGNVYSPLPFPFLDILKPGAKTTWGLVATKSGKTPGEPENGMQPIEMNDFVKVGMAYMPEGKTENPVVCIGTNTQLPIVFDKENMDTVVSYYSVHPKHMKDLGYGVGVYIAKEDTPTGHATAAIYGQNMLDSLAVGVNGTGYARGVYGKGLNGVLGISVPHTGSNGAAIWGVPAGIPNTGDYIYSGLFQDFDIPGAVGVGMFCGGFSTKPFTTPSDLRLKTDVRGAALGLATVMKLHPRQFRYIEGTPYSLPQGVQQGFIAQEVEEVVPELISDLVFPKSLDPDLMATSGTETYKGINYTGFIPILTQALQELNAKVDAQAEEIKRLSEELKACKPK